ncbi:hypothetical protein GCM10011507_09210 [Edaphobacter acidisoli]|uniref:Glycoside hydrolase family 88 protein n=1 Tax=Edaphobacter acidisoli TaxID=2040573 RepID=A0A916W1Y7_9BACT|nr:glycoside hydrolase family 88 protein [Edaphobacter acidisoli]GGA59849.1 hypothetical protein GCM10011507_09210 [Edaphobacter acidisoli]
MRLIAALVVVGCVMAQVGVAQESPSRQMAQTVIKEWPAGMISTLGHPGKWGYEEGVLLDGMAAEWHTTADGADFHYIKAAVDKYVNDDGTLTGYKPGAHTLDEIEMGRAILLVYRVTHQPKYYKAAKFLNDQLAEQPRTASGGYWHKQIYPNQMWLDGAYMAEPFRAAYAATFQQPDDFTDIAKQLLLMDKHMRDPKTGLLRHGWDESRKMPWADPKTGLSPEVWGRAMGWYEMALVDVLDWMPENQPERAEVIRALQRTVAAVVKAQDKDSGLWWQVMDQPGRKGNYFEASASCMFVYALAKGVRMGYLPQAYEENARRGWEGIQKKFIATGPDGSMVLNGTVSVGGLGGKPYRSGTYDYYLSEKVVANDAKGVGAFLKAGSEMEQASTEALGQGKTVMVDAWFNSQTRKNAAGQTELYHYKWNDDTNDGFAFLGRVFQRYGARLATEKAAPTLVDLKRAQIYVIASPDIPVKNPHPHYMDKASARAIAAWVRGGGVLLMLENDPANADIEHFNTLSDIFGIHYNAVLANHVVGADYPAGSVAIPEGTGVFAHSHLGYMKDTCTITTSRGAKAVVTKDSNVMIAEAKYGKGTVLAVVDPWVYNEYVDHRNHLPVQYDNFASAIDMAGWAVKQAEK